MSRQVSSLPRPSPSRIKAAQAELDLNNEELARRVGVSVRLLQKWRAGTTAPRRENVKRLGRVLQRPIEWFYEEREAA